MTFDHDIDRASRLILLGAPVMCGKSDEKIGALRHEMDEIFHRRGKPIAPLIDSAIIERARDARIEDEIARRGIRLVGRGERVGPCPVCGGTDRFSINRKKQIWNCRGCRKAGDVISLVQHIDGISFAAAIEMLAGERVKRNHGSDFSDRRRDAEPRPQVRNDNAADEARVLQLCEEIVSGCDWSWRGTPAETYLISRGINIRAISEYADIGWHPRCPWEHGKHGCLVARYTDAVTGKCRGIHRTAITRDGAKVGRRALGPIAGGVIRLWPDEEVEQGLVLGEGIETTLAAATRIEHRGTLLRPAWAAGSAGNMQNFPVLPGIEGLTLLVDRDESGAGERAATACSDRWRASGREVVRLVPRLMGADAMILLRAEAHERYARLFRSV